MKLIIIPEFFVEDYNEGPPATGAPCILCRHARVYENRKQGYCRKNKFTISKRMLYTWVTTGCIYLVGCGDMKYKIWTRRKLI